MASPVKRIPFISNTDGLPAMPLFDPDPPRSKSFERLARWKMREHPRRPFQRVTMFAEIGQG